MLYFEMKHKAFKKFQLSDMSATEREKSKVAAASV
jgi:hypothetical protein